MATDDTPTPARTLTPQEIADLLDLAIPAHLATLDQALFPRIIPIWFLWEDGIFYLSSGPQSRHVSDLARDPHAGLCITVEEDQTEGATVRFARSWCVAMRTCNLTPMKSGRAS